MSFDYINEAFKKLDILEEDMFSSSADGINSLSSFLKDDDTVEVIRVIDPEAQDEEDIEATYIGKVILNCNVCHSHIFFNKDDVDIDEEEGIVNSESQCPYCGEQEGFVIIGEIAPFGDKTSDAQADTTMEAETYDETDAVEEDSDNLTEDFKAVSITTDDQHMEMTSDESGKVTVTTEPIHEEQDTLPEEPSETIVPVTDETKDELLQQDSDEETEENSDVDVSFDEFDEESFDELGESYLKEVYDNVSSFRTTKAYVTPSQLIVEGCLTFNSGKNKKTGFIFESKNVTKDGKFSFSGSNKNITEATGAFKLTAKIDNSKLMCESLSYDYNSFETSVKGTVTRK